MHVSFPPTASPHDRILQLRISEAEHAEMRQRAEMVGLPLSA